SDRVGRPVPDRLLPGRPPPPPGRCHRGRPPAVVAGGGAAIKTKSRPATVHYGRCGFGIGRAGPLRVGAAWRQTGNLRATQNGTAGSRPRPTANGKNPRPAYAGRGQFVENLKIRRCRRTCADDSDTDREILRQECARNEVMSA